MFSDSNWTRCIDTKSSIIGYLTYLDSSFISWKSKKHTSIFRNSSEVEYCALANATYELQSLTYLFDDFGIAYTWSTLLFCDNRPALYIIVNPIVYERTKHIEIDCHIVQEKLHTGLIELLSVTFGQQLSFARFQFSSQAWEILTILVQLELIVIYLTN